MSSTSNEAIIFVVHKKDGTISIHEKAELSTIIDETVAYVTAVEECNHRLIAVYTPTEKLSLVPTVSVTTNYNDDEQILIAHTFHQCSESLYYANGRHVRHSEGRQLDYTTKLIFPIDNTTKVTLPLFTPEGKFIDEEIFNVLYTTQISNRNRQNPDNTDYGFYWSYNCSGLVFDCKYELRRQTKYELVTFVNQ